MANTPETPRIITDVIDSAEKRQTLPLGANDLAELADKSDKVKEEMDAKLTSREALQALKQTITTGVTAPENKMVTEDPVSMANLQRLEQQIDVAIATKPEAGSTEHKVLVAGKSVGSILTKLSTSFGNILGTMGSSTTLFFASIMESFGYKSAAEWLRGYAEPGVIRDAMAEKLKKPIDKTPDDAGHAKTLRAQYQAKIDAEKKDPKTYSFETFIAQKIDELRATEKDSYVLADLTSITSPEAKAVDDAKQKEIDDKKKQEEADKAAKEAADKIKEDLDKDPRFTTVKTFRDALKMANPDGIEGAKDGETLEDVSREILTALKSGQETYGLELDGGTLEESHKDDWHDYNIINGWEEIYKRSPIAAIKEFLRIDPEEWKKENGQAAATIRNVRAYMAEKGITEDSLTSGKGPATAPAPAPTVAGDSSSTGIGIMM